MSINKLKVNLIRFRDLPWQALIQFRTWLTLAKSACVGFSFDSESLDSPTQKVAVATDEFGRPIAFSPIEQVLLLRSYNINPEVVTSPEQLIHAGNLIDAAVAQEAQRAGISKVLLVVPKDFTGLESDPDFEEVRIYVRRVDSTNTVQDWGIQPQAATHAYLN